MWRRAVPEAKRFGRYPEEVYRLARLDDLKLARIDGKMIARAKKKFRKS